MPLSTNTQPEQTNTDEPALDEPALYIGLVTTDPTNVHYVRRLAARRNVCVVAGQTLADLPLAETDAVIWDLDHLHLVGSAFPPVGHCLPAVKAVATYSELDHHARYLRRQGFTMHRRLRRALRTVIRRCRRARAISAQLAAAQPVAIPASPNRFEEYIVTDGQVPPNDSERRRRIAVIGACGYNARNRVLPALAYLSDRLEIVGYDLRPPSNDLRMDRFVCVRDDHVLADRLREDKPDVVLIESPCSCHGDHLLTALDAGVRDVLTEKMLAESPDEAERLVTRLEAYYPEHNIGVIDHYLLLEMAGLIKAHAVEWMGDVQQVQVTLFESARLSQDQVRSHRSGMANFLNHAVALAFLLGLEELTPVEAAWARYPDAEVPDSYRAARFVNPAGAIALEAAVGKGLPERKQITFVGTNGRARWDRGANVLRVDSADGRRLFIKQRDTDSGYEALARALACGTLPGHLLSPRAALEVMRCVEAAHALAIELPEYPDGREVSFAVSH